MPNETEVEAIISKKYSKEFTNQHTPNKNKLAKVLLVLVFSFPFYENIPVLHEMYDEVFGMVLTCGSISTLQGPDIVTPVIKGYFGYMCLAKAMEKYSQFEGFYLFRAFPESRTIL